MRILIAATALLIVTFVRPAPIRAEPRVLDGHLHHVRIDGPREWSEFPEEPETAELTLRFAAERNETEQTLRLQQQDVKQGWTVSLNGKDLGRLRSDENATTVYYAIPPGVLRSEDNVLTIKQTGRQIPDDIRVGRIALDNRPMREVLSEATVEISVTDAESEQAIPCRITIVDDAGSLATVWPEASEKLAVRPGVVYTADGRARFGIPAGRYTIYAGRGFEWGLASVAVDAATGATIKRTLAIRREVPTEGYAACDTHVHTLTHSRHGDATIEERMVTLAGEGIELPVATDHNVHIDYEPTARKLGVRRYFTPVVGNEVTTKFGHFNVFPVTPDAAVPNARLADWKAIFDSIAATPHVKAVILNHARDIHSGFRPFGPKQHNALVGENLDGWELRANAMEVINSGATQTDVMRLYHDWFGLLNRGFSITPVGSSDSHDVARHFVGQGRTYIRCDDDDPGRIDIGQAVENFMEGRVMVSYGLLAEIEVDGRYGPGDVAPPQGNPQVAVRVLGPGWTTAEIVELYANGQKIREARIDNGDRPGVKWNGTWELTGLKHDVHLVAVARGPGIEGLYWPTAKPYQPRSPDWEASVIGSTGAVWLDVDGDGRRTSAYEYASRILERTGEDLSRLLKRLASYDEAVAAQAANLWQERGRPLTSGEVTDILRQASPPVRRGFHAFLEAWRESQIARLSQ